MPSDAKNVFGVRLRQGRTMKGYSLRQLAEAARGVVSHNALARYERGEMMPSSGVLIALSAALAQPVGFFFRPIERPLAQVHFRKVSSKLLKGDADAVRERAADYCERALETDAILGYERRFDHPLGRAPIESAEAVETAAMEVRKKWNLGLQPISGVVETLETHGVKVCDLSLPPGCDGLSGWMDGIPVMVLAHWLSGQCLTRKRWSALHELAHLLFEERASPQWTARDHEKMAHRFAGAMLIPAVVFKAEFGGVRQSISMRELIDMKGEYGISIAAILARAHHLGLVSDALYRRFNILRNTQGWREKEPGDEKYSVVEATVQLEQRVYHAAAEGLITRSKAAALLNADIDALREGLAVIS